MINSKSLTWLPLSKCLIELDKETSKSFSWQPTDTEQLLLFRNFYRDYKNNILLFTEEELMGVASEDREVVNRFAKDRGFDIQLEKTRHDTTPLVLHVFLAGLLKIVNKWLVNPVTIYTHNEGLLYESLSFGGGFSCFKTDSHSEPIIELKTKSSDLIYLTQYEGALESLELYYNVESLRSSSRELVFYDGVHIPKVTYNQKENVQWILGLMGIDKDLIAVIEQALQQTKFSIDAEGAVVESLSLIDVSISGCGLSMKEHKETKILIIDKPFLLWIERAGSSLPIFYGKFEKDTWLKKNVEKRN